MRVGAKPADSGQYFSDQYNLFKLSLRALINWDSQFYYPARLWQFQFSTLIADGGFTEVLCYGKNMGGLTAVMLTCTMHYEVFRKG